MKSYFAYIRVSTVKQGEKGSSLQEQRDAIIGFSARNGIAITRWFEERETAAKAGRAQFETLLACLRKGEATGVIFHKIDRSARNLRDWNAVQDLAESGIDVRFAQESINLGSNEGRLTGDFLAVISSHYIRNLREEVKKGIRGRLKQGLYPLPAPIGYLNQGGGKPKIPDPRQATLVREAFQLYASGASLRTTSDLLFVRGFRNNQGRKLTPNRLACMLRNYFYVGVIKMRSGDAFAGVHQPIIEKGLFDRVQVIMNRKMNSKLLKHSFVFARLVRCSNCGYALSGELQKGFHYYRCHTRTCPTTGVREEAISEALSVQLSSLALSEEEISDLAQNQETLLHEWHERSRKALAALVLRRQVLDDRMSRLMDLYLSQDIEPSLFQTKKLQLLLEAKSIDEHEHFITSQDRGNLRNVLEFLELAKSLSLSFEKANDEEKREIVKITTSNLTVEGKNVVVELFSPFRELSKLNGVSCGGPVRDRVRTKAQLKTFFDFLVNFYDKQHKDGQRDLKRRPATDAHRLPLLN